ncbi:hypothetical protein AX16_003457 [Volvariella volvacea WC 439]|nr:hypothetical protein AX16_003457 [Volvariella volvacea WC 439]
MSDSEDEDENEVDELQDEEALTISLDQMQSPAAQEQGKGVGVPEMAASPTYRGSEQLPPSSPLSVLEDKQDQEDGEQHEDALSRSSPISLPPLLSSPPPLPPALLPPTPPTATSNAQKRPYDPHRKSGFLGGLLLTPSTSPSNDKSTKTTPRTPLSQSNSSASLAIALMSTYTKPTPSPTRRKIQPSQRGVSRKRQRSPSSPAVDGRPLKKLDLRDYFARMREKAKGEAELRHQEASMTSGLSKPKLSRGNEEPERVEDGRDQALSSPQSRSRDQNSKDGGSGGVITEIGISEADMLLAPTGAHAIGMMEEHTMLRMSLGRRLGLPVRVIGEAAAGQQERQELLKQSLGMAWRRRPLVCRPFVRKTERYLEALESAFGPGDVTRGDGPTKPVSLQPNANKRKRPSYVYNGQSSESEWEEAN